jgi:hypothetical protein
LERAAIPGTSIFPLPLLGTPAPPNGPLAQYPIFEPDEWGTGGGGGGHKLKGCQERELANGKWKVSYMSVGKRVDWDKQLFNNKGEALAWMRIHCE